MVEHEAQLLGVLAEEAADPLDDVVGCEERDGGPRAHAVAGGVVPGEEVGGVVHQAEDEIAACAFAIGASYAGKCTVTITSGPGYSLKQEAIGLAVMAEIPLVVVNVQRGGPSTGQPTKAEQGDLLTTMFGSHGDAPKVVLAASTVEDCFYSVITARKIAEAFNMVVVVLSDSSLLKSRMSLMMRNRLLPD